MIIISLSDCPPALRGDLTKWLQEISVGVYVGQMSARVREEIWARVKDSIRSGKAVMVYTAMNEQGMDFKVHNSGWNPIDFDGIKLMIRPSVQQATEVETLKSGFSKAAKYQMARLAQQPKKSKIKALDSYVVLDLETTGLSVSSDVIIEIGAIYVEKGEQKAQFHALVKPGVEVPSAIEKLTGLSNAILNSEGQEVSQVLRSFSSFSGELPIISHNASFDMGFLRAACERCGVQLKSSLCIDTLGMAKRLVKDAPNYKLATLIQYFGIEPARMHRSINDCIATKQIYVKLIEIG